MILSSSEAKKYSEPEKMASVFLNRYFNNQEIKYPINPFKILQDYGVIFKLSNLRKLEGVYIPASSVDDIPVVGININRPITRQRFTAAHELCHHLRDADRQISCPIGAKDKIEKFAESFAAALLMPLCDLKIQVKDRMDRNGHVNFDDVLDIADYFGVSFASCLYRIAYLIHAIDGDTSSNSLKKKIIKYSPDYKRKARHMTFTKLYEGLLDNYNRQLLSFQPTDYAKYIFQNEYIYNDSRMEGLDVTLGQASEIVTDLRLNTQNSVYCSEQNEVFMSIAGHYAMYQEIFHEQPKDECSIQDMFSLNQKLFSCYPYPDFGGRLRQNNTLVMGAKFETIDYRNIAKELDKLEIEIKKLSEAKDNIPISEFIKCVARIHHRITVIHPFADGNGRTSRAFMNMQLISANLPPVYIKIEDKQAYVDALHRVDACGNYDELYEIIFKILLNTHVELNKNI